jgi:HAD superfamily hydrolase (TIGR01549 family)
MEEMIDLPAAVLLDMDGTLTRPMLDFPRIKAEMGIGTRPILEALAELEAEARAHAERVLHRYEDHAAENSTLNSGCQELLDWLKRRHIRTALITRNSRKSVETVIRRHRLELDVLVTREDGPFKPDPHPLRLACKKLSAPEALAWMVGDGQYDIEAGAAAGIRTVWVSHGKSRAFDAIPWREVRDLCQLLDLLSRCRPAE